MIDVKPIVCKAHSIEGSFPMFLLIQAAIFLYAFEQIRQLDILKTRVSPAQVGSIGRT